MLKIISWKRGGSGVERNVKFYALIFFVYSSTSRKLVFFSLCGSDRSNCETRLFFKSMMFPPANYKTTGWMLFGNSSPQIYFQGIKICFWREAREQRSQYFLHNKVGEMDREWIRQSEGERDVHYWCLSVNLHPTVIQWLAILPG